MGYTPVIPVFGRLKLEGYEFEASLNFAKGWRRSSMAEDLPDLYKALDLSPSTTQ